MIEWFLQGNWHDYKYYFTVPFCLFVGYLVGWFRCKEQSQPHYSEAFLKAVESIKCKY